MTKILNSILLSSLSLFPLINSYSNPDRENTVRVGSPFWHFFTGQYNYQEWYGHDNFDGQIFNGLSSYGCFCNHFIGFGGYHKRPDAAVDYIDELCRQTELALECVFHDVAKPEYEDDAQAWDLVRNQGCRKAGVLGTYHPRGILKKNDSMKNWRGISTNLA